MAAGEGGSFFRDYFFWNAASPTAEETSSTRRISGSRCAATANASRKYLPLEKVFDLGVD